MVEIYINLDITFDIKRDIYSIFVVFQCSNENRKKIIFITKEMIYIKGYRIGFWFLSVLPLE